MVKKEARGRPPLPEGEARDRRMEIRVNERELSGYEESAKAEEKKLAQWVRDTLNEAAGVD